MTILPENSIQKLIATYRKLKARRDAIDKELEPIKAQLQAAVEAQGVKYMDMNGYARMVERKTSVSYIASAIDDLAIPWSKSNDPIMQSCGNMLLKLRKTKAGYSYLQVK